MPTRRFRASRRSTRASRIRSGTAIQFLKSDGIGNYNALSGKLTQRFGSESDDAVQLHVVEGAGREQRDSRNGQRFRA